MIFRLRWIYLLPLLVLAIVLTHWVDRTFELSKRGTPPDVSAGPWGDLQIWSIRLEQPIEYAGFESLEGKSSTWHFGSLQPDQINRLLLQCGVEEGLATHLLRSSSVVNGVVVLHPDEESILALPPEVRSKLYRELANDPANKWQASPYLIPHGDVKALFNEKRSTDAKALTLMSRLCYKRNGFTYFSDPEIIFSHLQGDQEKSEFKQALTGQSVVLARLLLRKGTDIDKPLNYWALSMPNVLLKDLRPFFEAQQSLPDGGSISLLYLLPPMAREHLYTTPLPPKDGSAKLPDCHWTALNFFNPEPDPRLADNDYATHYLQEHYYQVAQPGLAGDLVLLLDDHNRVIHSSVYLAADLVFTKNGVNYAQPWVLMHEKDMAGHFSALDPVKVAYFRRKGN